MRRNSRGGFQSTRGPNSKEWDGSSFSVAALATTTVAGWIIDPVQAIDDYESPTLIRCLVAVSYRIASAGSAAMQLTAFGLYVASGDEDDVTVPTLLWDPIGDEQSDWVFRHVHPDPQLAAATPGGNGGADITIDVKTKRKIPRGCGLLAVAGGLLLSGSPASVDVVANVRTLIISG